MRDRPPSPTLTATPETGVGGVVLVEVASAPTLDASGGRRRATPADLPPRSRDRYTVTGEQGRGGLGVVLRALDGELGRVVAIKELQLQQRSFHAEARFVREATITARLQHPGIVRVYDAGRGPGGTPFYTMELVAGRPLHKIIEAARTVEARLALVPHVVAVADAMAYAHAHRIVHRDLKPSNVMVGDFGETVVIDWGLAKDLTEPDGDSDGDDAPRPPALPGLTSTGMALGTPAFMAPEQARGDASEASDIYSLGALLFNVVAGRPPTTGRPGPLPPTTPRDLVAIVERATTPAVIDRYPTARALADDLRRFQRREPVSARHYRRIERLALAAARHRRVASVAAIALVAITLLSLAAVALVSQQRDRAVGAESTARTARRRAETTVGELTLANARMLLATDPSRAIDMLDTYRGADTALADLIRAEARSLGVATLRLQPHRDDITLLATTSRGELVTAGEDASIALTSTRSGTSTPIATDVGLGVPPAFAADRVAYVSASSKLIVRELSRDGGGALYETALPSSPAQRLSMSPGGDLVAVLFQDRTIGIWRPVVDRAISLRAAIPDAFYVLALPDEVVIGTRHELIVLSTANDAVRRTTLPGAATTMASDPAAHRIGVGFADGRVQRWRLPALTMEASRSVCPNAVADVSVEAADWIGYACVDRRGGALDTVTGAEVTIPLESPGKKVACDASGRFVAIAESRSVVTVWDLATGFSQQLRGHGAQVGALRAPSPHLPYLVTADDKGEVRLWTMPEWPARLASPASHASYGAAIGGAHSDRLVAVSEAGIVRLWNLPAGDCRLLRGHSNVVTKVRVSPDQRRAATSAFDGTARLWDLATGASLRALAEHEAAIADLEFLDDDTLFVGGYDGRVVAWSPRLGSHRTLYHGPLPITNLEPLPVIDAVAAKLSDGRLVIIGRAGRVHEVPGTADLARRVMRATPDGRLLALGGEHGQVTLYDATTDRLDTIYQVTQPIRHLAFDDEAGQLAIAGESGALALIRLTPRPEPTLEIHDARTRYVALSHDGRTLAAAGSDGALRLYRVAEKRWVVLGLHGSEITTVSFSTDDRTLTALGIDGRLALVDMARAFLPSGARGVPALAPFPACAEDAR